MLAAGKLDRRIAIQRFVSTDDSFGQPNETWTDLDTVWANVKFMTGSERINSAALHSVRLAIFTIRYRTDVTEVMRISFQGLYWKIIGISELNIERSKALEITAEVVK